MPEVDPLELSFDSNLRLVRELAPAIRELSGKLGFGPEAVAEIELAVCEAVNNAIIHAYQGQPGHPVKVVIKPGAEQLVVQVIDQGLAMADGLPEADKGEQLSGLAEGGRGLRIISSAMDKVRYRQTTAGNILELRRRLP